MIIPYFQVEAGILTRCVKSILAQELRPAGIIIVDDGSPHPADIELRHLTGRQKALIRIIRQENTGPGPARNVGLDALPADASAVAFLDSDDAWTANHLTRMAQTLELGFDICIANWRAVEKADGFRDFRRFNPDLEEPVAGTTDVYDISAQLPLMQIRAPMGKLSALAMRCEGVRHVRFTAYYRHACEDRRYVMELSRTVTSVAAIDERTCIAGIGISMFSSVAWNTKGALHIHLDRIRFCRDIMRLDLPAPQRIAAHALRREVREQFFVTWAHLLRRNRGDFGALWQLLRFDPIALFVMVVWIVTSMLHADG